MNRKSQRDAVTRHRLRLREQGLSRYEVRGLDRDKELVRQLAQRLAVGDDAAAQLRVTVAEQVATAPKRRGRILAALRRSPMVGAGLSFKREVSLGRNLVP
ncbi:MAG: hypothetical protein HYZ28_10815 [Myxococcales bacterium]|nr:hypothetical protein [Myxococcales bacterium]